MPKGFSDGLCLINYQHRIDPCAAPGSKSIRGRTGNLGPLVLMFATWMMVSSCTGDDTTGQVEDSGLASPESGNVGIRGAVETSTTTRRGTAVVRGLRYASGESVAFSVDFSTRVIDASCSGGDDDFGNPCPELGSSNLVYIVMTILNGELTDIGLVEPSLIRHPADGDLHSTEIEVDLGVLPDGSHCLTIALIESSRDLIDASLPDHSPTVVENISVGESDDDYCLAGSIQITQTFEATTGRDCGGRPHFTTSPDVADADDLGVIQISSCPYEIVVFLIWDDSRLENLGRLGIVSEEGSHNIHVARVKGVGAETVRVLTVPVPLLTANLATSSMQGFLSWPHAVG